MTDKSTDKPWEHPERSDWNKVLHFMADQMRDGKSREQVIQETSAYIDEHELKFSKSNITSLYSWLYREVKKEVQQ